MTPPMFPAGTPEATNEKKASKEKKPLQRKGAGRGFEAFYSLYFNLPNFMAKQKIKAEPNVKMIRGVDQIRLSNHIMKSDINFPHFFDR